MNVLDRADLKWKHFTGGPQFDYPIDYSAALLSARADGHVELAETLARNGEVIGTSTVEAILKGRKSRSNSG